MKKGILSIDTKFECRGKRGFKTKGEAMVEILRLMDESSGGSGFLRPYKCKYCKDWHFTSY